MFYPEHACFHSLLGVTMRVIASQTIMADRPPTHPPTQPPAHTQVLRLPALRTFLRRGLQDCHWFPDSRRELFCNADSMVFRFFFWTTRIIMPCLTGSDNFSSDPGRLSATRERGFARVKYRLAAAGGPGSCGRGLLGLAWRRTPLHQITGSVWSPRI